MLEDVISRFKKLYKDHRYEPVFDTLIFVVITFAIHYLYRYWITQEYRILGLQIITPAIESWFTNAVYLHSSWIVNEILPVKMQNNTYYFYNQCTISINNSCSGIQQMAQFAVLMLVYPGPWKHKAWYIPVGTFLVYLTNIVRITGLCIVMENWPQHWYFAHDYPFRVIFYVVIFILWAIWNDRFYHRKSKPEIKAD